MLEVLKRQHLSMSCPQLGEVPSRLSVSLPTLGLTFMTSTWDTVGPGSLLNDYNCGPVTKIVWNTQTNIDTKSHSDEILVENHFFAYKNFKKWWFSWLSGLHS